MKVYRTDEIRNVVLLGHGGSGKTSLVEAMAYVSGATNRMGKVVDKNTISDFDKEEQKRGFSLSTTLTPIEWEKAKINVLDTPGYFDFVGEVEEAVSAADAAVIVVSGKAGVEVGTEKAWALCDKYNLPRMVYVTEMDVDDASFRQVVQDLTDKFGKVIAPHFQPIRENEKLVGYVNVIKNAGRRYTGLGQREECEIPDYCKPNLEMYREKLLEAVAEISDEYMERYFAGDEFSVEEIRSAMRTEVMEGSIVPVAMGSNIQAQGVANLLSDIVRFFPSPDWRECAGINRKTNEIYEANYDFARAKSAYVFKTMVDPFIGKYSFIKVCSGVLKGDDTLYNADTDTDEKLGKIYTMFGNKPVEVSELFAGDIGAIAKLTATRTGDTLSTKTTPVLYGKTEYSKPYTYMKYKVKKKGEEILPELLADDAFLQGVQEFSMFDPDLLRSIGFLPNEYLYYYYHREKALENIQKSGATRGKTIENVNIQMMDELKHMDIDADPEGALQIFLYYMQVRENSYMSIESGLAKRPLLEKGQLEVPDGMGYAGVMLDCIEGMQSEKGKYLVLSVENNGSIPGLADEDVIETTCLVSKDGIHPVRVEEVPEHCYLLIRLIKMYEKLTVEAVKNQSKETAVQALMLHPLVNSYSLAKQLVDKYDEVYGGIFH